MTESEVKLRALKNPESISEDVLSADSDSVVEKKARGRSRRTMASVSAEWDVKFSNQQQEMASIKQTLSSIETLLKRDSDSVVSPSRQKHSQRVSAHSQKRHSSHRHKSKSERYPDKTVSDSSSSDNDDRVSLHDHRRSVFSSEDDNINRSRSPSSRSRSRSPEIKGTVCDDKLSEKDSKDLFSIFGEDATVKKDDKKVGISLDKSQIDVIENSWHHKNPSSLSTTFEENFDLFPVDDESEKYLSVPSLEPLVEGCLKKKHGERAKFGKKPALYTQPCKMIEKQAYSGQQSARMAMTMQIYVQQSLGNLMQSFKNNPVDKDFCVSQIQEIFSMSTKCLEQIGRTGAFHHIVRRCCTMTDTALYSLSDRDRFYDLPLSSEGVFGPGFATLLKDRKEQKKLVDDLLDIPDLKKNYKRKSSSKEGHSTVKKQYVPTSTVSSARASSSATREPTEPFVGDFQIPKRPDFRGTPQFRDRGRSSHRGGRSDGQSRRPSGRGGRVAGPTKQ